MLLPFYSFVQRVYVFIVEEKERKIGRQAVTALLPPTSVVVAGGVACKLTLNNDLMIYRFSIYEESI